MTRDINEKEVLHVYSVNQKKEVTEDQQFYFMGRREKGTAENNL